MYNKDTRSKNMTKELYDELKQIEERLFYIANEFGGLFDGELSDAWSSLYSYLEKIEVNELE